jgi:energy-coupling factor transport system permease protein
MDARGYGRRAAVTRTTRRLASGATAGGLLRVIVGTYGMLDPGSLPAGGIPFVTIGAVLLGVALVAGGRRTTRTRYRPDVWRAREWGVSGSGAVVLVSMVVASAIGVGGLQLQVYPLHFPTLPVLPLVGILFAIAPAWLAPPARTTGTPAPPIPTDPASSTTRRRRTEPIEGAVA